MNWANYRTINETGSQVKYSATESFVRTAINLKQINKYKDREE